MNKLAAVFRDTAMAVILLWIMSPYISFFSLWVVYAILWFVWIVSAYVADRRAFSSMIQSKYTLIVFLWPTFIFLLDIVGWGNFAPYQYTISFLIVSIVYYIKGEQYVSLKVLLIFFFVYVLVINIYSIVILQIDPNVSRNLAQADKSITQEFAHPLLANFSHINNLTLLSVAICAVLKLKVESKIMKIIMLSFLILNIYTLFLAQYALALITFIIFAVLVFTTNYKKNFQGILRLSILVILVVVVGGPLLLILSDSIESNLFANRARSLGVFLTSGTVESGSDFQERLELYSKSINAFIQNPIFGVGGAQFGAGGLVGGHSDILDRFGYFGLFGGSFFVYYLYAAYKNVDRFFAKEKHHCYAIIFLSFLFINVFNPGYQEAILYAMYFISPALLFVFNKEMS